LAGRSIYREGTLITPSINGLLTYVSVIDPIWVYFSIADNMVLLSKTESTQKQLILLKAQDYNVTLELADGSTFPFTGKVNFASPSLDPETGALMVRAEFRNPQGTILPGQFVRAKVTGAMRPDAIFVPQQSVFQGKNGMYVFVINKDNTVSSRLVIPGEWVGNNWVIKQGLNKGDVVVVEGVNKVQDGTSVHILSVVPPPQQSAPKAVCPIP
jgi:membrane fusion protein (multidrug efflux system)